MTKQEKADWKKGNRLEDVGFNVRPAAVRVHGRNETAKHLVMKALICRTLQRRGRTWDTEVELESGGRVDVLDFGEPEGHPLVYEVQTNCTPAERLAKVEIYTVGPVRDVIFLDPVEAPDAIPALVEWIEGRVV